MLNVFSVWFYFAQFRTLTLIGIRSKQGPADQVAAALASTTKRQPLFGQGEFPVQQAQSFFPKIRGPFSEFLVGLQNFGVCREIARYVCESQQEALGLKGLWEVFNGLWKVPIHLGFVIRQFYKAFRHPCTIPRPFVEDLAACQPAAVRHCGHKLQHPAYTFPTKPECLLMLHSSWALFLSVMPLVTCWLLRHADRADEGT